MIPTVASRLGQSLAGRIHGSGGMLGTRLGHSESKNSAFLLRGSSRGVKLSLCNAPDPVKSWSRRDSATFFLLRIDRNSSTPYQVRSGDSGRNVRPSSPGLPETHATSFALRKAIPLPRAICTLLTAICLDMAPSC